jgi:hypothetical protein
MAAFSVGCFTVFWGMPVFSCLAMFPSRQQSVTWVANKSFVTPSMTNLESKLDPVAALGRIARPCRLHGDNPTLHLSTLRRVET